MISGSVINNHLWGTGIYFTNNAGGLATNNDIYDSACGIWVTENANPKIEGNQIRRTTIAIEVDEPATPSLIGNNLENNETDTQDWRPAGTNAY